MSISKEVIKQCLISKQREELKSIKSHAKNAKTQSFFLVREEFKNIFFSGFKLLMTLRLSVLCENFFIQDTFSSIVASKRQVTE